ncbi:MAG: sugar phosphate isomerase/epimerase [Phycisphaerales bacterium]|nr:sugar phosphate isomerase/epimerase [Phycisphaerales bacterium]
MQSSCTRRDAIKAVSAAGLVAAFAAPSLATAAMRTQRVSADLLFQISLAQWSLNKPLFAGEITCLDFAHEARDQGINAIEYVNSFFKDKARDQAYLKQLNARADEHGVKQLLIMVDGEGALGDADEAKRTQAIENHKKWIDAAKELGCHSIRVNAASSGSCEEQQRLAADGLRRLTEIAEPIGINIIVENHGGYSSNGRWLSGVMRMVDHPMCGTLPDFGNFCLDWSRSDDPQAWYDRYQGVKELMPFAKAVSAKTYAFDEAGNETTIDYNKMMKIVLAAGYHGYVGIEYEGSKHSPRDGIRLTKALLERIRDEMSG